MAKATIQDVPQVFIKNPKLLEQLRSEFGRFYDQENKPIRIYDSQLQKFNERIHSPEINIDPKLTPKELGIKFEEWFEILNNTQETITEVPRPEGLNNTTLTSEQLENFDKDVERIKESEKIRADQKKVTEDFVKKGKSVYDEQQKIQEQIKRAQEIQSELKNKTIYAQVVLTKEQILSKQEEADLNTLREIANLSQDSRTKLIDDLSEKIVEKIRPVMIDATEEEIALASRNAAIDITEKISTPESRFEVPTQVAILSNLTQTPETQRVVSKPEVIQELEKGSMVLAQHKRAVMETNESITRSLLGKNIAKVLYGNNPIQVIITDKFIPGTTTHTIQLEGVNQDVLNTMRLQDSFLMTLKEKGIDHIREVGIGQTRTFINNQVEKVINKLPKESALKTIYSSETVSLILNRNQLMQQPVFMNTGNIIGSVALRVAPKYAPILTAIGGGSYAAVAASSYAASYVTIQTTAGIFAAEAFAGGAGGALAGASAGSIVPVVGTAIGAVVGYVGGELLSKVASKLKVWWTENKDVAAPAVGVGTAFFIAPFFGAGPAVVGGVGAFALFGGSVAGLATGAFGVLGLIGRSVGIAIATPVIVTLLVLPPLVAFIMLVINNSAYVVPPGLKNSSIGGGIVSPYIDIKKTASPTGPFENSDLPVKINYSIIIGAKKGTLSNIKVKDTCKVISKNNTECPQIDINTFPTSVAPGSPKTITYTSTFDSSFKDSVIINTISISADTDDQKGVAAEASASITIGNPPISCPLPGGFPDNQMNYSYNSSNDTGHGSTSYWGTGNKYYFPMPQSTSCFKPTDCPYYGYSYDVFPSGTTDIFAPSVLGKDVAWNCSYAFSNGGGSAGHTYKCKSSDGNYLLVLTHMQNGAKTGEIKSGEKIGVLYNQGGNTHLHLEFQLDGQWQKPENYFCK